MNIVRRVVEILTERTIPAVGALIASHLEKVTALEHADHLDELEERARRLDDQGKSHIAAALRARAAQINPDNPAAQGLRVVRTLGVDSRQQTLPQLDCAESAQPADGPSVPLTRPKPKQRSARRIATEKRSNRSTPSQTRRHGHQPQPERNDDTDRPDLANPGLH